MTHFWKKKFDEFNLLGFWPLLEMFNASLTLFDVKFSAPLAFFLAFFLTFLLIVISIDNHNLVKTSEKKKNNPISQK